MDSTAWQLHAQEQEAAHEVRRQPLMASDLNYAHPSPKRPRLSKPTMVNDYEYAGLLEGNSGDMPRDVRADSRPPPPQPRLRCPSFAALPGKRQASCTRTSVGAAGMMQMTSKHRMHGLDTAAADIVGTC